MHERIDSIGSVEIGCQIIKESSQISCIVSRRLTYDVVQMASQEVVSRVQYDYVAAAQRVCCMAHCVGLAEVTYSARVLVHACRRPVVHRHGFLIGFINMDVHGRVVAANEIPAGL